MTAVQEALFALGEESVRDFTAKLIPTLDPARIIGIRTPRLRSFAKDFAKRPEAEDFLKELPHFYLEENGLHAFLLERVRSYDDCVAALDAFLPRVDNWATCDGLSPACFKKHRDRLLGDIRRWLDSGELYTMRFGIRMLMCHYLDEDFCPEALEWPAEIATEEYYLRMMQAWHFATALAKRWDETLPYLEERRLEPWTHNRAIQKALESWRITPEQKAYLKTLRQK